ncbi:MAG: hypothetical protein ACREV6_25425 [Clostridium sp.]|uniref:hypothetical protein n=1 Tax=Clostridium sp. TaxID=1506 RepID=UPI003D6CEFB0
MTQNKNNAIKYNIKKSMKFILRALQTSSKLEIPFKILIFCDIKFPIAHIRHPGSGSLACRPDRLTEILYRKRRIFKWNFNVSSLLIAMHYG